MNSTSEENSELRTLLALAHQGDQRAFNELIEAASVRLQRMARMMLANYPHLRRWEQTDDVLQVATLRLHRALTDVRPDSARHFFALAATQIRRTLIDLLRHQFGPQGHGANYRSDTAVREGNHASRQPGSKTARGPKPETLDDWTAFHEAAGQLPDEEREVLELTWYGGLQQAEIGELLGVSIPTVQCRWQRARRLLHDAMLGELPADRGK
ncbi:MAG: sigma-70 family RNA polymerase sigma factor [Planctomycetaceae bacterium]|nr:sigma-70 family RNA polymerase sigma factor [Planctomycetaceae bacterium]